MRQLVDFSGGDDVDFTVGILSERDNAPFFENPALRDEFSILLEQGPDIAQLVIGVDVVP